MAAAASGWVSRSTTPVGMSYYYWYNSGPGPGPGPCQTESLDIYTRYILSWLIYLVYTWFIPGIWKIYTWYMTRNIFPTIFMFLSWTWVPVDTCLLSVRPIYIEWVFLCMGIFSRVIVLLCGVKDSSGTWQSYTKIILGRYQDYYVFPFVVFLHKKKQ